MATEVALSACWQRQMKWTMQNVIPRQVNKLRRKILFFFCRASASK